MKYKNVDFDKKPVKKWKGNCDSIWIIIVLYFNYFYANSLPVNSYSISFHWRHWRQTQNITFTGLQQKTSLQLNKTFIESQKLSKNTTNAEEHFLWLFIIINREQLDEIRWEKTRTSIVRKNISALGLYFFLGGE